MAPVNQSWRRKRKLSQTALCATYAMQEWGDDGGDRSGSALERPRKGGQEQPWGGSKENGQYPKQ